MDGNHELVCKYVYGENFIKERFYSIEIPLNNDLKIMYVSLKTYIGILHKVKPLECIN